jgi:hypothetical protein
MDREWQQLAMERDLITRQANEKSAKFDLREGEATLTALGKKKKELARFVDRVEAAVKESTSPATLALKKMAERAKLFEVHADFDEAIALWEKILEARPDQPQIKDHLAELKTAWLPKNAKHAEARAFLTKTWPRLEVSELSKNIAQARAALAVCKDAGDKLTPLKVMQAGLIHASNVRKQLDALARQNSVDSASQAKAIAQLIEGLRWLDQEATALAGKKKE